ncbi:hypothetical protein [Candidatus Palauibacter sp.]|uniref:hypothetical protein n=1 Tax=Candidatus Palauibacter sp. TaxID=3101350 RepID=UPI003B029B94
MKKKLTLPAFALALVVGLSGCDLQVSNPNEPDRGRALASPDDVETLIASTYQKVWAIGHYWDNANFAFNHVSSRHTATWGNNGQNDLGREPREPMPNSTSYRWAYVFYEHWNDAYGGIAAASDGIRAIDEGLEIGPGGERNARARAFAVASQAMLSCLLSLWYDQSFIVDETTDLTGELDTVDYDAMFAYAMGKLDEAESAARAASFSLPDNWINGNAWSNTEFADYLVSWKARCAANLPRTDAGSGGGELGAGDPERPERDARRRRDRRGPVIGHGVVGRPEVEGAGERHLAPHAHGLDRHGGSERRVPGLALAPDSEPDGAAK